MANNDEVRSLSDLDFARRIGQDYGERLIRFRYPHSFDHLSGARRLMMDLLDEVKNEQGFKNFSVPPTIDELVDDLAFLLRLTDASRNFGGMLIFKRPENPFRFFPLVDLFDRCTLRVIGREIEETPLVQQSVNNRELGQWSEDIVDHDQDRFAVISRQEAIIGFMTLFLDSLRAIVQTYSNSNTVYLNYTVHARNNGYSVDYYPQYRYRLRPFANGKPTNPSVSDNIKIGHYYFEGVFNAQRVPDPTLFFAGPTKTNAYLRAF
jgi:hypothetical protein